LVRAKVTSSGIVLNSGDGEERVPAAAITVGNAAGKITRLAGKLENSLNPFVIYGAKVLYQTIPSQCKTPQNSIYI
jgi:hypothetical protein